MIHHVHTGTDARSTHALRTLMRVSYEQAVGRAARTRSAITPIAATTLKLAAASLRQSSGTSATHS
jgi:hypothetical protein